MSEQGQEFIRQIEVEDDVEGHRIALIDGPDADDVEGHVQPPRGDDTDCLRS